MNYTEQTVTFACEQDILVGILANPEVAAPIAVIVIVGGPQYRVGSHRQFVLLSRTLAAAGYPVLRFDYRGMGDSTGHQRDFLQVTPDIAAAINALQRQLPAVTHVALWGLCDGASAALLYCHDTNDQRVAGLCLLNPWVRSEASLARTHVKHYYADRLRQKEFWLKLLSGRVAVTAATGLWRNLALVLRRSSQSNSNQTQPFQLRMALAWHRFDAGILLLLSGNDYTAQEFMDHAGADAYWKGLLERPNLARRDLPDADHTFSAAPLRTQVEGATLDWLKLQTSHRQHHEI